MARTQSKRDSALPYGVVMGQPRWPVVALAFVYAVWFLFLLWAAIERATSD